MVGAGIVPAREDAVQGIRVRFVLALWTALLACRPCPAVYIIVTAAIDTPTYTGQTYNIHGTAQYSAPAFPVKGANVMIALRGSNYTGFTINDGTYSVPVWPMPVGVHTAVVRITDTSVWGTNRLVITVVGTDQDSDGLPDSWEQQIVDADPGDAIDSVDDVNPQDDFDGDHMDNACEYACATQPTNSQSYLKTEVPITPDAGLEVRWFGATGRFYTVLSAPDLSGSTWETNVHHSAGTGTTMSHAVTSPAGADGYFRIRVEPP